MCSFIWQVLSESRAKLVQGKNCPPGVFSIQAAREKTRDKHKFFVLLGKFNRGRRVLKGKADDDDAERNFGR